MFYEAATLFQWIIGLILIASVFGVIILKEPVHASLSFLLTLMMLAALYLQLSANFIAVMQVLVYAGAILVIFMFVVVLFQDAHDMIKYTVPKCRPLLLYTTVALLVALMLYLATDFVAISSSVSDLPSDFGTVQSLGKTLYVNFFIPFEAMVMLFLIAIVGALYIGRRGT